METEPEALRRDLDHPELVVAGVARFRDVAVAGHAPEVAPRDAPAQLGILAGREARLPVHDRVAVRGNLALDHQRDRRLAEPIPESELSGFLRARRVAVLSVTRDFAAEAGPLGRLYRMAFRWLRPAPP